MRFWQQQSGSGTGGVWFAPVFFGFVLIIFGVMIFAEPKLLAFLVATLLILAGGALLGLGWHLRGRVTYRRMDDDQRGPGMF